MPKQITITYQDAAYTLEYTRRSVQKMESDGFIAEEMSQKPTTMLPKLFFGAFSAHHPTVKKAQADEIYKNLPNRSKLIECLTTMYIDTVNALVDEPENAEGNASWVPNWEQESD